MREYLVVGLLRLGYVLCAILCPRRFLRGCR